MANPAKRKVDGASSSPDDGTGDAAGPGPATSSDPSERSVPPKAKAVPPKAKAKARREEAVSARYTPSRPTAANRPPSPRWVPALMFGLWGAGVLVIILNYMEVLPGTADQGNGWYLVAGLVSILAGIMVATQYR